MKSLKKSYYQFKKDDYVIVFGFSKNKYGTKKTHRSIAKVVSVGVSDLFVTEKLLTKDRAFTVSKERCALIKEDKIDSTSQVLIPKTGDLVHSIVEKYSEVNDYIGIVTGIIDIPGRINTITINMGEEDVTVPASSAIVLESH